MINSANATPVDWTADLSYTSPYGRSQALVTSTLTGTFTYDADTKTLSNVNLVNYAASAGGITYNITNVGENALSAYIEEGNTGGFYLRYTGDVIQYYFAFSDSLTNAGGVLNTIGAAPRMNGINTQIKSSTGTLTGVPQATAVPEPEAYAMMLAGLGLVGFAARRKLAA